MTAEEQSRERELRSKAVSINAEISREKLKEKPDEGRLAELKARLAGARSEYEEFRVKLYANHPDLKAHRGEIPVVTLSESTALMTNEKTALLEFVVMEDKTLLFVLSKKRSASRDTPELRVYTIEVKQKDLASDIESFTRLLADRRSGFQPFASQLYRSLLKPARLQLQNVTDLVIVPDGVLWGLPFQVLQDSGLRHLLRTLTYSSSGDEKTPRKLPRLEDPNADASGCWQSCNRPRNF
jgi:CHAT domain-containing protein